MRRWIWTFQSRYNSIDRLVTSVLNLSLKELNVENSDFEQNYVKNIFQKLALNQDIQPTFMISPWSMMNLSLRSALCMTTKIFIYWPGFFWFYRMGAFTWILMYFLLIGRCIWIVPAKTLLLYIFICGKRNRPNSIELWPFKSTNCLAGKMKNLKRSFKTTWKVFYLKKWLKINIEVEVVLGIDGDIFTFSPYSNSIISDRRSG